MLIRQPPVLPSLRIGISRSSGEHSRYTVWKESNDDVGCCRCIFELAKPYGNNERMAGVKVLLEVQQNLAEMGGVYHLILVVDDQIPYFKKGQAIADPSSKKDMT